MGGPAREVDAFTVETRAVIRCGWQTKYRKKFTQQKFQFRGRWAARRYRNGRCRGLFGGQRCKGTWVTTLNIDAIRSHVNIKYADVHNEDNKGTDSRGHYEITYYESIQKGCTVINDWKCDK